MGIKLTEGRLVSFTKGYENDYSLDFIDLSDSSKKPSGTTVVIRIPLI